VQGAPRFEAYALQEGRGGGGVVRGRLTVAYVTSEWGDNSVGKEMVAVLAGTHFTCFTGTKVQILTRLRRPRSTRPQPPPPPLLRAGSAH
jgi:hypothetical protein